jgi:hypothetical protein
LRTVGVSHGSQGGVDAGNAVGVAVAAPSEPNATALVPGESLPSATVAEFLTYLMEMLGQDQWPKVMRVLRVLDTMATTGMLHDTGGELFNHSYITADVGTKTQKNGWLHLSEVLGAALIIPTYGAITIPFTGTNRETGNRDTGFGLVLNNRYVLTYTHVIRDMELDGEIPTPKETPPAMVDWRAMPETIKAANAYARPDDHLDVGIRLWGIQRLRHRRCISRCRAWQCGVARYRRT